MAKPHNDLPGCSGAYQSPSSLTPPCSFIIKRSRTHIIARQDWTQHILCRQASHRRKMGRPQARQQGIGMVPGWCAESVALLDAIASTDYQRVRFMRGNYSVCRIPSLTRACVKKKGIDDWWRTFGHQFAWRGGTRAGLRASESSVLLSPTQRQPDSKWCVAPFHTYKMFLIPFRHNKRVPGADVSRRDRASKVESRR
jgi:hypothetical protein